MLKDNKKSDIKLKNIKQTTPQYLEDSLSKLEEYVCAQNLSDNLNENFSIKNFTLKSKCNK